MSNKYGPCSYDLLHIGVTDYSIVRVIFRFRAGGITLSRIRGIFTGNKRAYLCALFFFMDSYLGYSRISTNKKFPI